MRNSLLILLFSSILSLSSSLFAQNETIRIKSKAPIIDRETNLVLDGVKITVLKDGKKENVLDLGASGKFDFSLALGHSYDIKFSRKEYVSKIMRIDTRNIPSEDRAGGFQIEFEGSLFKYVKGFDKSILKEPIGRASFDQITNYISFDFEYTDTMLKRIDEEFKRLKAIEEKKKKRKK